MRCKTVASRVASFARAPELNAYTQPRSAFKVLFPSTSSRTPAKMARILLSPRGHISKEPTMNTAISARERINLQDFFMEERCPIMRENQERQERLQTSAPSWYHLIFHIGCRPAKYSSPQLKTTTISRICQAAMKPAKKMLHAKKSQHGQKAKSSNADSNGIRPCFVRVNSILINFLGHFNQHQISCRSHFFTAGSFVDIWEIKEISSPRLVCGMGIAN
ncbi:hypothetical protein KIN20_032023 [Parelaphostrongylus tenuis]|uniref:Uncharacterized protein n=1 Tax=Parelaphostrongylus tenuis TaxID=148309 RepID=A0AAD5WHR2_PARTN|nr:hypothetical protein KIN20_032023 [Parelaphostrongylus tenuis]